jgi:hypothetical protein
MTTNEAHWLLHVNYFDDFKNNTKFTLRAHTPPMISDKIKCKGPNQ